MVISIKIKLQFDNIQNIFIYIHLYTINVLLVKSDHFQI